MQCFITGATGFIGSAITSKLLDKNYEVKGLTHSPDKVEQLERKGVEPVVGDMNEPDRWISSVKGADAIIHTASIPVPGRPGKKYLKRLAHAQRTVVRHLIDAASQCSAFVYTSGKTVYGEGKELKTEQSKLNPVRLAKPYLVGEHLVQKAVKKRGLPGMILRPAGVYGDGGIFAKHWTDPASKGKRTTYPGNGKQLRSFVSQEDCAQAFVKCVENPMPGEIFNIADDEPMQFREIVRYVASEFDAPKPLGIPSFIFRLVGGKILAEMLLTDMTISNKKMKEQLGVKLKYPTYREGITAMAKSIRQNKEKRVPSR